MGKVDKDTGSELIFVPSQSPDFQLFDFIKHNICPVARSKAHFAKI